jgi:hypothetical protein
MKKIVLSLGLLFCSFMSEAQVIFKGISPQSIAGIYTFTNQGDSDSWGLANLNDPADAVEGELKLVEDGTPGNNATFGNPLSQQGCAALTNDLTGKIAVIYRGGCTFTKKCLNAQQAGAIACIVINNEPAPTVMAGANADGPSVTIPVTNISNSDGAKLVAAMLNGPVVVFIGNKSNKFDYDLGSSKLDRLIPKAFANPTVVSSVGADFSSDLAIKVRNFGKLSQSGVTVNAKVKLGTATVYNQTSAPVTIAPTDSSTFEFPPLALVNYSTSGRYTLTYEILSSQIDADTSDNTYETDFLISDSLFSYAPLDAVTNYPTFSTGTRPTAATSDYSSCIVFSHPEAHKLGVEGMYFSSSVNAPAVMTGIEIEVSVNEIVTDYTNLEDAPAEIELLELASGLYTYSAELPRIPVYQNFSENVILEDDKRYLFCAKPSDIAVFMGFNNQLNYDGNEAHYLQAIKPLVVNGAVSLYGFSDLIPSLAVKMSSVLDVKENYKNRGSIFPNPANNSVHVSLKSAGNSTLFVSDVSGKIVFNEKIDLSNGGTNVDISKLNNGMYIFKIALEDGSSSIFNVVKN